MTKKARKIKATIEVDPRKGLIHDWADTWSISSAGGIATTDGGTFWMPEVKSSSTITFKEPPASGGRITGTFPLAAGWPSSAAGSGWSSGTSTTSSIFSTAWTTGGFVWSYDEDFTPEQRKMISDAILEQIAR